MPRRAAAVRRETQPDAKFNNRLVTQLINKVLLDGKKSIAENIVYGAFDLVQEKTGEDPLTVFKKAMDNVRPTLECKPKRVGGATYQVPMEVNSRRATTLAIRWIVDFSRKRKEHTMRERLANEIIDASNNTGAAVKKREDMYKMAEANRAFSQFVHTAIKHFILWIETKVLSVPLIFQHATIAYSPLFYYKKQESESNKKQRVSLSIGLT